MRHGMRTTFITILYCLGVLVFFEATARVVLSSDNFWAIVRPFGDDTAYRLLFIRRQGKSPTMAYSFDVYHPTRGWAFRPGLSSIEVDNATFSSNSRGLRGSSEHAYEKPLGSLRILTFGRFIYLRRRGQR
jgi:hypothetical protein